MNFDPVFPEAPYSAFVAKLTDGNQDFNELIIPHNRWMSFLLFGCSISVTARILLSGGSKNMTELFFIFSADMMVPPNFTAVLRTNFDGANLRFIFLHNFINFSICNSRSSSVLPYKRKSSMFLRTLMSS